MAEMNDKFTQSQSYMHMYMYMHMFVYIPLQFNPSSSNTKPLLHPQLKSPTAFIHTWEQLSVSRVHSSISGWKECM